MFGSRILDAPFPLRLCSTSRETLVPEPGHRKPESAKEPLDPATDHASRQGAVAAIHVSSSAKRKKGVGVGGESPSP